MASVISMTLSGALSVESEGLSSAVALTVSVRCLRCPITLLVLVPSVVPVPRTLHVYWNGCMHISYNWCCNITFLTFFYIKISDLKSHISTIPMHPPNYNLSSKFHYVAFPSVFTCST